MVIRAVTNPAKGIPIRSGCGNMEIRTADAATLALQRDAARDLGTQTLDCDCVLLADIDTNPATAAALRVDRKLRGVALPAVEQDRLLRTESHASITTVAALGIDQGYKGKQDIAGTRLKEHPRRNKSVRHILDRRIETFLWILDRITKKRPPIQSPTGGKFRNTTKCLYPGDSGQISMFKRCLPAGQEHPVDLIKTLLQSRCTTATAVRAITAAGNQIARPIAAKLQ